MFQFSCLCLEPPVHKEVFNVHLGRFDHTTGACRGRAVFNADLKRAPMSGPCLLIIRLLVSRPGQARSRRQPTRLNAASRISSPPQPNAGTGMGGLPLIGVLTVSSALTSTGGSDGSVTGGVP